MTAIGSRAWVLTLAALTATTALSIDMSLPAQPAIAGAFGVGSAASQLTLSPFLVGYSAGMLLVGALSDRFGRRAILLASLAVFFAGGVASALAPSIGMLVGARILQGFGASGGPVLARAMVRDTQPIASAARILASMMSALALAPMIAPAIGGVLLDGIGWRAIFGALGLVAVGFLVIVAATLEETLPRARRASLAPAAIARNYAVFFRTSSVRAPMLAICLGFGAQFAFISASPFVLIEHYGVATKHYAFYFGATALALMGGARGAGQLLRGRTPRAVWRFGAAVLFTGSVATAAASRVDALGIAGLMAPVLVVFVGIGLTNPSTTAMALEPVPTIAGTASAIMGASQMLSGAAAGWIVARVGGSDAHTLGSAIGLLGASAAAMVLLPSRPRPR